MSIELPAGDPWVRRGYGQRPNRTFTRRGKVRLHRRYAEVTSADEVIGHLERPRAAVVA